MPGSVMYRCPICDAGVMRWDWLDHVEEHERKR